MANNSTLTVHLMPDYTEMIEAARMMASATFELSRMYESIADKLQDMQHDHGKSDDE